MSLLALGLASAAGCRKELETVYGQRSGPGASASVNGTAVFAEMFETAGHRVSSWDSLSPRLDQADCIVWFPDDFHPPGPRTVNWFENWLRAKPGRTLIYVGRDFDAAAWYWRKMQSAAPADRRAEIARLRAEAEAAFRSERGKEVATASCRWFTIQQTGKSGLVTNVSGDPDWIHDIDPAKLEVEASSQMSSPLSMDALLESDEGLIVGRLDIGRSQLVAVSNGSFLLNATLVNHEHRKLAGKLVDAIGPPGQDVVFLESARIEPDQAAPATGPAAGPPSMPPDDFPSQPAPENSDDGPPIRHHDRPPSTPNGLELLLVWPTNWILVHFAVIGILFCFWKLPIFGLARRETAVGAADFGRHIDAVAALLKRTADREYALFRVKHYQMVVKKRE